MIAIMNMSDEEYNDLENDIRRKIDDESVPPTTVDDAKNENVPSKGDMIFTKPKPKSHSKSSD